MKTSGLFRGRQQGHTIMLTLVVSLVLGVILLGVIRLANTEGKMTGRSQNWNAVMPIVEAGIEEALTHLKHSPSNRASHGWSFDAEANAYVKTRTFGDGIYTVKISTNYDPVIIARGGIRGPGQTDYSIYRTVRVRATNQPLFSSAMEGATGLKFNGNIIRIDSYDSRDPRYSLNGGYNPATPKDGGDIVSYGGSGSLDIGNADVYGMIKTGPDASYNIGPQGSVGSLTWNQNGVQPGWSEELPETEYPQLTAPIGGTRPPAGSGDYKDYQYVLSNGVYQVDSVTDSIVVTGQATLLVTEELFLSGKDVIQIQPGGSLKLYVAAPSASLSGIADANPKTDALNLIYYGLPSNGSLSISGNAAFNGVIYAPYTLVSLNGGGADTVDFSGAIVAKHVTMNGKFQFHFDEALRSFGSRGIVAASWDEISPDPF